MSPGPRPKPTALKQAQGLRSHKKQNTKEPKPMGPIGEAPKWMTKQERAVWDEYISLTPPGLLTSMDAPMFARWVAEYILYQRAHDIVSKSNDLSTVAESGYESPIAALAIMRKSSEVMLKIENEMGFTPAARTKIAINEPPEESEFERFVNKMKTAK